MVLSSLFLMMPNSSRTLHSLLIMHHLYKVKRTKLNRLRLIKRSYRLPKLVIIHKCYCHQKILSCKCQKMNQFLTGTTALQLSQLTSLKNMSSRIHFNQSQNKFQLDVYLLLYQYLLSLRWCSFVWYVSYVRVYRVTSTRMASYSEAVNFLGCSFLNFFWLISMTWKVFTSLLSLDSSATSFSSFSLQLEFTLTSPHSHASAVLVPGSTVFFWFLNYECHLTKLGWRQ